ncbi:semaphorin-4B [Fundulus heteroclitus]|uniref:semaphorin-4B n=1 Tax=Fundulus heteroclitus TaxID=8078 RepID=UPI00165CECCB|nr:semaphorin-4B [Fundulus heteroclitus]
MTDALFSSMSSSLILLFLGLLLGSTDSLPPPRISFPLNSTDRPLFHFSLPDVSNTTTLLLSEDSSTLYVGARDAVLSLDVSRSDVISLKKKVRWSPSVEDTISCASKGKNPLVDCPNFVHDVQALNSTHLYVCGSYGYNPHQAFIDMERLTVVRQDGAKGRCPYSPLERSSAVIIDEELFTATTTDFMGRKPQISRFLSKDGRPDVSLDSSVTLLDEPTFVSSSLDPAGQKLYFFFTEVGKEFSFVNDLRIPRVAQVCKNDVGGQRTLQKKWTSFAKSSLLCQPPNQPPFTILEDVFTLQPPEGADSSETLFYGVFTSQWSRRPESAVCSFRLQDIKDAFTGSFMTLEKETNVLKSIPGRNYLGKCGLAKSSDSQLSEVKRSYLTSKRVKQHDCISSEQKYSRVAVMRTQAASGKQYNILFLLKDSGFLHKVVSLDQGPRVIEEIQVFREPQLVKSLVLSPSKGVLYVGTSEGVTAVPVARCSVYRSCRQCILARDPLCGWSRTRRTCTGLDGSDGDDIVQNVEGSGSEDECLQSTQILEDQDVFVQLNEAVKLPCQNPSGLARLSWRSTQEPVLSERLFIQAADGSLSFLASGGTFGTYRCEAEEDGGREVVASYSVRQAAGPRHQSELQKNSVSLKPEEHSENVEEPAVVQVSERPKDETLMTNEDDPRPTTTFKADPERLVTSAEAATSSRTMDSFHDGSGSGALAPTSRKDSRSMMRPAEEAAPQRSYHSELVVVSLLLAVCVLVLAVGSVHIWKQRRAGSRTGSPSVLEDESKASTHLYDVSAVEEAGPDQTILP